MHSTALSTLPLLYTAERDASGQEEFTVVAEVTAVEDMRQGQ